MGWIIRAVSWIFRWGEHIKFADDIGEPIAEFFGWKKGMISAASGILAGIEAWRENPSQEPIWIAIAAATAFAAILVLLNAGLSIWHKFRRSIDSHPDQAFGATKASLASQRPPGRDASASTDARELKIIFDENDPRCVRDEPDLYGGVRRRHYSVGIKNVSKARSIDNTHLRALESHFVLCAISPEHIPLHRIVDRNPTIIRLDTLAPGKTEFAEMFSLGIGDVWGEHDILAKKHVFSLEAYGRDAPKTVLALEYNPSTKPPTVRKASQISLYEAAMRVYEQIEDSMASVMVQTFADTSNEKLVAVCEVLARPQGNEPLVKLYGNHPPSREIKEIYIYPLSRYEFVVETTNIILQDKGDRYENLFVPLADIDQAILTLKQRAGEG